MELSHIYIDAYDGTIAYQPGTMELSHIYLDVYDRSIVILLATM
jgi:hypothetical protein